MLTGSYEDRVLSAGGFLEQKAVPTWQATRHVAGTGPQSLNMEPGLVQTPGSQPWPHRSLTGRLRNDSTDARGSTHQDAWARSWLGLFPEGPEELSRGTSIQSGLLAERKPGIAQMVRERPGPRGDMRSRNRKENPGQRSRRACSRPRGPTDGTRLRHSQSAVKKQSDSETFRPQLTRATHYASHTLYDFQHF